MSRGLRVVPTLLRQRVPLHRIIPATARLLPGSSKRFGPPRQVASNADCARRNIGDWTVVYPAHEAHRPAPVTFRGQRLTYGSALLSNLPDAGLLRLNGARVVPSQGWVIAEPDCFLPDNSWIGWDMAPFQQSIYRRWRLGRCAKLGGVSLNLTSEFAATNYGHLILDALPRLALFLAAGNRLDSVDHVILPTRRFAMVDRFLAAFAIPESKSVTPELADHLACEILWAPSFPGYRRNTPGWVVQFWRRYFSPQVASKGRRLFLGRSGQKRRILNRSAVEAVLARHGFEEVSGDTPPARFAEADVIVGEYGAAMADIVFCREGTKILELTPPGHRLPYFYTVAAAGGMPFHSILGSYPQSTGRLFNSQAEGFNLDPSLLEEALAAILS